MLPIQEPPWATPTIGLDRRHKNLGFGVERFFLLYVQTYKNLRVFFTVGLRDGWEQVSFVHVVLVNVELRFQWNLRFGLSLDLGVDLAFRSFELALGFHVVCNSDFGFSFSLGFLFLSWVWLGFNETWLQGILIVSIFPGKHVK